jgi:D-amino-acid dehydrogenase
LRVAIIGAGIVGTTTAHELTTDGHEVTVFDRCASVASEASFANAGVASSAHDPPWAGGGLRPALLRGLLRGDAPLRLRGLGTLGQMPWLWRWWRGCQPAVRTVNRLAVMRLARFSQSRLFELTRDLALDYEQRDGVMVVLRSERELVQARAGLKLLAEQGASFELLDAERARLREPGLNPDTPLRAAIHLPNDGVGNCRQFAQLLKAEAQRRGADFRFDQRVQRVVPGTRPAVVIGGQESAFDAVVLCSGVDSNELLRPLGLALPLAPVYGYSLTAPLRHADGHPEPGPRSALIDDKYKVSISRLGQRIRVSGGAELGGGPTLMNPAALRTLYRVLDDWFPGAAQLRQAQAWKGARPMLPDGPPILGASGAAGVWLNLGHGSSGWALSCGSARLLADQVAGREPPLDFAGLGIGRVRR